MNEFGTRLRSLREQKKMTLRFLAERAKLSYSFIASLEKGRYNPSRESIYALAGPLDTDVNELLTLAGFLPNQTPNDTSSVVLQSSQHSITSLEEVMEGPVVFQGKELTQQDKAALLAFVQTLTNLPT